MIIGVVVAFIGAIALKKWGNIPLEWVWICLLGGAIAAGVGRFFGLPPWWVPLNGFFPICVYILLSTDIPGWVYLLCFFVLALFYWNSANERVPLYLSNPTTWQALAKLTESRKGPFLDLGCGLGGALFYLASHYPERSYIVIESAPMPYFYAKMRQIVTRRRNVKILYGNFWGLNLGEYQTIYAFLSPAPMKVLFQKIESELAVGGQFISNSFVVPDKPASDSITLGDKRQTTLHIWQF